MKILEKYEDITDNEMKFLFKHGYVCVDTETTGLSYINDELCTIQLFCEDFIAIIRFNKSLQYDNLKNVFLSDKILKIFHNAVFDVSFLMRGLNMVSFGKLACTKISSKLINGLDHNNSLKPLLSEYLGVEISKAEQMSDWSQAYLSQRQKEYAVNDVRYLYLLWNELLKRLKETNLEEMAFHCFEFVPYYKRLTDKGIENIFSY